ncbi:MAG: flagellar basal body P-ring formation chaperone FlgA [Phycisphaerales bacterium]
MVGKARAMVVWVAAALASAACLGDTVTLRTSATVRGNVVRLSDVAALEGPEAERLADVVLVEDIGTASRVDGVARVDVRAVRKALDAGGAKWGRLALQGSVCEIRASGAGESGAASPGEPSSKEGLAEASRGNVRGAVEEMLARVYGVEREQLRVTYDVRDWGFLAREVWGKRVEAQPGGSATGTKQPVRVWVYDGDRVALEGQVTASVEVRKRVAVLTRGLRRGDLISEGDVTLEEMWVEGAGAPADVTEVVGREARTRLSAGSVVRSVDVEAAQVIRRGDLVTVHCVSGGVVVKAPARALADAREGEMVELRMDGSKRSFMARASGSGRAVLEVGGAGMGG